MRARRHPGTRSIPSAVAPGSSLKTSRLGGAISSTVWPQDDGQDDWCRLPNRRPDCEMDNRGRDTGCAPVVWLLGGSHHAPSEWSHRLGSLRSLHRVLHRDRSAVDRRRVRTQRLEARPAAIAITTTAGSCTSILNRLVGDRLGVDLLDRFRNVELTLAPAPIPYRARSIGVACVSELSCVIALRHEWSSPTRQTTVFEWAAPTEWRR